MRAQQGRRIGRPFMLPLSIGSRRTSSRHHESPLCVLFQWVIRARLRRITTQSGQGVTGRRASGRYRRQEKVVALR